MKGNGSSFGFHLSSAIGEAFQHGVDAMDDIALNKALGELNEYLRDLNIVYR